MLRVAAVTEKSGGQMDRLTDRRTDGQTHTRTHTIFKLVSITRVKYITQDPSNKPTSPLGNSIPMTSQLPINNTPL